MIYICIYDCNAVFLNEQNDRNRHTSLSYRNVVLNIILKENFYEKMETVNLNEDVLEIGNLSVASNMGWAMLSNEILTIVKHFLLWVGEDFVYNYDVNVFQIKGTTLKLWYWY